MHENLLKEQYAYFFVFRSLNSFQNIFNVSNIYTFTTMDVQLSTKL